MRMLKIYFYFYYITKNKKFYFKNKSFYIQLFTDYHNYNNHSFF